MRAHVFKLLNLLNELGKSHKMRGLLSILSLFHKEHEMLDSIYHMILKLLYNCILS